MKLGLERNTLENLGYAAFNNAISDIEEATGTPTGSIERTENYYQALVAAFSEMIEANNAALLQNLKQLGVLDE